MVNTGHGCWHVGLDAFFDSSLGVPQSDFYGVFPVGGKRSCGRWGGDVGGGADVGTGDRAVSSNSRWNTLPFIPRDIPLSNRNVLDNDILSLEYQLKLNGYLQTVSVLRILLLGSTCCLSKFCYPFEPHRFSGNRLLFSNHFDSGGWDNVVGGSL